MPSGNKFFVENKDTGRRYSNNALSRKKAVGQMRALYAAENGYRLRSRSGHSSPFNVRLQKRTGNQRRKSLLTAGCWPGYHRVPGTRLYSKHSCRRNLSGGHGERHTYEVVADRRGKFHIIFNDFTNGGHTYAGYTFDTKAEAIQFAVKLNLNVMGFD